MKKIVHFFTLGLCLLTLSASFSFAAAETAPKGYQWHKVKDNENFYRLTTKNTRDTVKRINRIDAEYFNVGSTVLLPIDNKVLPSPVPQEIEEARNEPRSIYVFLDSQYFGAYENGQLQFWGPISSGKKGHRTPPGVFQIMSKEKDKKSKKYNNAPMAFAMQISEDGVFFHQEDLPGYPASHGCIRLLMEDAEKLFHWAHYHDRVIITRMSDL